MSAVSVYAMVVTALAAVGWFAFFCAESAIRDQRATIVTRTVERNKARREAAKLAALVDRFRQDAARSEFAERVDGIAGILAANQARRHLSDDALAAWMRGER